MALKSKGRVGRPRKTESTPTTKIKLKVPEVKIGEKVRKLRKENGYSIQKLAELSGVSPAGIYKIETNGMVPTVTTLVKLATALEHRVSHFVEEENGYPEARHIRKKDREIVSSGQEGRTEVVAERLRQGRLESVYRTLEPGSKTKNPIIRAGCEHLIYCLKGDLCISRGDNSFHLKEGDSFHCESKGELALVNDGRAEARFLVVNAGHNAM
ncbi:MAG: helix-turn-helix transcriptional regulator [Nitrospinaceae bacterium]|jgi:transcriptional regulator with XRE-family HTH domain|nr:helix-turn-helix transcriptional regulator [Nitrospinaceae bacterium]MBT3434172.1 helix-turn-helix transcriptional regulator [Nitrospinaceae bacterium]MBT3821164.1 helix-turn-helix transcriptional regulator [Nitrospinaceae bacterium]MBT4094063.1 helix-turn-helix transcriptional regulator [Nitrospinaceae bacterium]MBT4432107.1 helix-turn-helix transcriptional regulator [Nitrospinaceae bacterium]